MTPLDETPSEPVITRADDGMLSVRWPYPLARFYRFTPEVLRQFVEQHNALLAENKKLRADVEKLWESTPRPSPMVPEKKPRTR